MELEYIISFWICFVGQNIVWKTLKEQIQHAIAQNPLEMLQNVAYNKETN